MRKIIICLILMLSFASVTFAQIPTYDKDKYNEIMSLERKHWDFSPSWYYYFLHKNYSGAYLKWKWNGPHVRFKESKSNVKTVGPRREKQVIAQLAKDSIVGLEQQYVDSIYREEVARSADRNVDLVYPKYKDIFMDYQKNIARMLTYCIEKSKGKMSDAVMKMSDRNEEITSRIAYLHKTGVGYELENAKREKGYGQCLNDLDALTKDIGMIVIWASAFY